MTLRERLLNIPHLKMDKRFIEMTDHQIEMYVQALHSFIDSIPAWEAEMKTAMFKSDIGAVSKSLATVRQMLTDIYEEEISAECLKQNNSIRNTNKDKLEAYLTYLITSVATLSIDIQMALFSDKQDEDGIPLYEAHGNADGAAKSILAVDDKAFFLDSLKTCLLDTHYKLTGVTSGKAALNYLQKHTSNLFILDIEMPGMDGFELAKNIRSRGHKAPIIFLTANSTKEHVIKAIKAGAADFLVKPINKNQVLARIGKFL